MPIPYLTLIIPTHNRSHLLRRALLSVNSQSIREEIQVIVVSDYVCADSDLVCRELLQTGDIYACNVGQRGPSSSRNLALKLATGQHIMFLDDDDSWNSGFTEALLSSQNERNFDIVYFDCTVIKESRAEEGPIRLDETFLNLSGKLNLEVFIKNQVHLSCFLFSKSLISGLEFDLTFPAFGDWDFLLSVFARKMPRHIPILCSQVFEVDDSTTDRMMTLVVEADLVNAAANYIHIYLRHPAPSKEIKIKRKVFLENKGIQMPESVL